MAQILSKSGAFVGVKTEPPLHDLARRNGGITDKEETRRRVQDENYKKFQEQRQMRNGGQPLNKPKVSFPMSSGDIAYTFRRQNISKVIDLTTSSVHCMANFGKNIVPGGVATASEERKDKNYEIVWNKHKDFIDSIGFDHNGGWGKQALEVLKELFKIGDH